MMDGMERGWEWDGDGLGTGGDVVRVRWGWDAKHWFAPAR